MKKNNIYHIGLLLYFLFTMNAAGTAQVATSNFYYAFANPQTGAAASVLISNSQGTVCTASPSVYNYHSFTGTPLNPGGVSWNDSATIQAAANNTPVANRFKAIAGRSDTITIDISLGSPIGGPLDGFFVNTIEGTVEGRIGTYARINENGSNPQYDKMVNFTKTLGPVFTGQANHYIFKAPFVFKRGSTAGYIYLTIPVKNYDGNTRYEEFIVPYLVAGALDEQVKHLGYTSEPKIPYMILHDPPGDGSSATLSTTTQSCRSTEETYSTDASNTAFGTVKLGVKGSIGFVATVDYEIFAEFSASATIGDIQIGSTSSETCIAITHDITTSTLSPDANTSDLFIGYGMDMWYGVTDNLKFDGCSYSISKSLIYQPKDGTITDFVYSKQDILDDIAAQQAILTLPGLSPRDSAKVLSQIDVWNQVIALNDSNLAHPDESNPTPKNFSSISTQNYSTTVNVNQSHTITVEHYIDAEAGLQGVVNVAGSGFSAGYKYTSSKRFGNTSTSSSSSSQTIGYSLSDDDPGDAFSVRIVKDPMYGTPVFQIQNGTKTSCPYEGGIQRDQPRLEHVGITDSAITFPNVPVNEYQSFDLRICNDAAERRSYRLRLKNNNNNAVVTAGGNAGPEFTSVSGISLAPRDSAGTCTVYRVDVHQLNLNSLSFPDLEFELYALCDDGISESVFATINYGTLVKSVTSGSWMDVNTWQARRVPQPTDEVTVDINHLVALPPDADLKCKAVTVNAGASLEIPPTTKLSVKGN